MGMFQQSPYSFTYGWKIPSPKLNKPTSPCKTLGSSAGPAWRLMCSQDWLRSKYKSMFILFFCSLILFTLILSNCWFFFLVDNKEKEAATFWSCLQDIQEGLQELELWAKQVYRHGYWWLQVHHLFTWTACILAPAGCVIAIVLCNWCFPLEHVLLYKFWYLNMAYCHC